MKKKRSFKLQFDTFLLILFLIISSSLMAFSGGELVHSIRNFGFSMASGTEKAFFSVSSFFSETVSAVRELSNLKEKYAELELRLKDYEILQRSNAEIALENYELRSLLNFSHNLNITNTPAEVIGANPDNLYSGILINRGVKHGIRKNMPVVAFQGKKMGLVGKVIQAGRSTSMIMPLYDYQAYASARFQTSKHQGLVNGQGGMDQPLAMRYIKKRAKDDISVGDIVVTSGENYLFPKGIPIGTVSEIKIHSYETSLDISIEPIVDFSRLEYVFILDLSSLQKEVDE